MTNPASLPPGFRFHPTDEELILHYLRNRTVSIPCPVEIIAEVDIYKFDPWELPDKALYGDKEWYFFSPRDRKYPNGTRPNRAAGSGYWKATGTDKPIHNSNNNENIGVKKALVFYKGRPPKGMKTSWIMHEYRLAEARSSNSYRPMKFRNTSMRLDDWVLCRIYKKSNQISPIPPLVDHDHDDSSLEENHNYHYPTQSKIPKSCSVSDFLVDCPPMPQFFENLHDMTVTDHNSFFLNPNLNHAFLNGTNNNMVLPVSHMASVGSSLSVVESSLKRHRMNDCNYLEEGEGISNLNPITKKQNISCIDTSYSNPINSLEECFIDHQTLYGNELLLDPTYSMR